METSLAGSVFNSGLDLHLCSAVGFFFFPSLCAPLPLFSQSSPSFLNCPYQNWVVLLTSTVTGKMLPSKAAAQGLRGRSALEGRSDLTPRRRDHSSFGTSSPPGWFRRVAAGPCVPKGICGCSVLQLRPLANRQTTEVSRGKLRSSTSQMDTLKCTFVK